MDFIKLTNKCINIYMFHYQNLMTGFEYAKENVPEFLTMLHFPFVLKWNSPKIQIIETKKFPMTKLYIHRNYVCLSFGSSSFL